MCFSPENSKIFRNTHTRPRAHTQQHWTTCARRPIKMTSTSAQRNPHLHLTIMSVCFRKTKRKRGRGMLTKRDKRAASMRSSPLPFVCPCCKVAHFPAAFQSCSRWKAAADARQSAVRSTAFPQKEEQNREKEGQKEPKKSTARGKWLCSKWKELLNWIFT